jgi:hypothetical protein
VGSIRLTYHSPSSSDSATKDALSTEIEITPEMIEAGEDAISARWGDFVSVSGYHLMDEVLRRVFLAMMAKSPQVLSSKR